MELCVERDPAFWRAVAADPDAARAFMGLDAEPFIALISNPGVIPLATTHGGFVFVQRDNFGRVFEMHSLFTRAGWGREAMGAAMAALEYMFAEGADLILTHEIDGQPRTRPSRRAGARPLGDTFDHDFGRFRLWGLTRADWLQSPARAHWRGDTACPQQQ